MRIQIFQLDRLKRLLKHTEFVIFVIFLSLNITDAVVSDPAEANNYYIDYENGFDSNPGTKDKPWRHHPWDPSARFVPANVSGLHTYIFKKGVVYRGWLIARESGTDEFPIVLTSEQGWGGGQARLHASETLKGRWSPCKRGSFPEFMPDSVDKIWYLDWRKTFTPRTLFVKKDDGYYRLDLAREPDWRSPREILDDNVKQDWWETQDTILELEITLDQASDFQNGDRIYFEEKSSVFQSKKFPSGDIV